MKKLLSIAFVMGALIFVCSSNANAQTYRNNQRVNQTKNNRGVRTYTQTKIVRIRGQQYRETYQVKVRPNGKTTSKLISRVQINNRNDRYNNGRNNQQVVRTYYQTRTIRENGRNYRVTYKITQYRNGRTQSQIVSKVRA